MSEFVAPDRLPEGMKLTWEGVIEDGWDRISEIRVTVGASDNPLYAGVLAINHNVAFRNGLPLSAPRETVPLLRSTGMENQHIADAVHKSVDTVKSHQQQAGKCIGRSGAAHLITQRFFDTGVIEVKQTLTPVIPPGSTCRKFLCLLSIRPSYAQVGASWTETRGISEQKVKDHIIKELQAVGELPSGLQHPPAFVLWWNLLDSRFKQAN